MKYYLDDVENALLPKHKNKFNIQAPKETITVYSVSYMDGEQRVILFTTDKKFAQLTRKEASGMEIFAELDGVEISVINSSNLEVALMAILSSRAYWGVETGKKNEIKVNLFFCLYKIEIDS